MKIDLVYFTIRFTEDIFPSVLHFYKLDYLKLTVLYCIHPEREH